jgi:heat shock protein HslJ
MKRKILYLLIPLIIIAAISLSACDGAEPATGGELEGVTWSLERYGDTVVLDGSEITAVFDSGEGQVSGSAGCNHYFGGYQVSGSSLTVSQIGYTEMYCMYPEGVMEQESEFLRALQAAESYEVQDNGILVINCGDSQLVFTSED